jgi:hypothetical protein
LGETVRPPFGDVPHLVDQLTRFCREIEGDFWERGDDLRDLFRPGGGASRLTWRAFSVRLDALPGDSLYKTAVRDSLTVWELADLVKQRRAEKRWSGFGRMSNTDLLLARLVDLFGIVASGHQLASPPDPYPVPGVVPRGMHDPRVKAALRAIAEEHAALHGYELSAPDET